MVLLRGSGARGRLASAARLVAALAIGGLLPILVGGAQSAALSGAQSAAPAGARSGAASPPEPLAEAQHRVEAARRGSDGVAGRYFAQLDRYESLGSEITGIEARVGELEQQARSVRAAVQQRAVAAYKTGSSGPELAFDTGDFATVSRAVKLLDAASAHDGALLASFRAMTDDLKARRDELTASRHEQGETLKHLRVAQQELDANLRAALSDRRDVVARLATAADRIATARPARASTPVPRVSTPPADPLAPPPGYVPHGGVHPRHDDPFLVCTRSRESGGDYSVVSPDGPFYGAYQFLQSTWNITANHAGRPELAGVRPSATSEYDQDDMAWALYTWQGNGPWGGRC